MNGSRRPVTGSTSSARGRAGREFPNLGVEGASPSAASRVRFFVTSPHVRPSRGESSDSQTGPLHAKRMGTTSTACGELATSWPKLWDVAFSPAAGPLCHRCVVAVTDHR